METGIAPYQQSKRCHIHDGDTEMPYTDAIYMKRFCCIVIMYLIFFFKESGNYSGFSCQGCVHRRFLNRAMYRICRTGIVYTSAMHISNQCIAHTIVSLVISGDLGDGPWSEHWRNGVHDQQNLTRILLIIITFEMICKISSMSDGKYWADCRLNGDSGPFLEKRNFRFFLNYHWWDLMNTKLHCLHRALTQYCTSHEWIQIAVSLEILEMQLFCHMAHLWEIKISASPPALSVIWYYTNICDMMMVILYTMKINHPVKSGLIAPILQEKHKECCCRAVELLYTVHCRWNTPQVPTRFSIWATIHIYMIFQLELTVHTSNVTDYYRPFEQRTITQLSWGQSWNSTSYWGPYPSIPSSCRYADTCRRLTSFVSIGCLYAKERHMMTS